MRTDIVLTLTGKDRVGIVEEITQLLFKLGGNVETSQMARLGGEFAMLVLVSLPSEQLAKLEGATAQLAKQGYKFTTTITDRNAPSHSGWDSFQIEVEGADHEGIVHEIARSLAQRGISVESMETGTQPAPTTGSPLFTMTAQVVVPPGMTGPDWQTALRDAGQRLNVEINVTRTK